MPFLGSLKYLIYVIKFITFLNYCEVISFISYFGYFYERYLLNLKTNYEWISPFKNPTLASEAASYKNLIKSDG